MTKPTAISLPTELNSILPVNQKLELKAKDWKGMLPANELKVAIAVALNQCVEKHRMQLLGYWITQERISLIIEGSPKKTDRLLKHFYDLLVSAISDHLKVTTGEGHVWKNWQKHIEGSLSDLFERHLLHDPNLIKLLLGEETVLPYHNAEVERMKQIIKQEYFCSAIDYSGAEGPVKVNKKWKE